MFLLHFVVYAAIFDVLYGILTVLLLVVPVLALALASTFIEGHSALDDAAPGLMMLFIVPWKAGTLWSAARASRRSVDGETFFGAIRGTLGEARAYLTMFPIVGRIFARRASS